MPKDKPLQFTIAMIYLDINSGRIFSDRHTDSYCRSVLCWVQVQPIGTSHQLWLVGETKTKPCNQLQAAGGPSDIYIYYDKNIQTMGT